MESAANSVLSRSRGGTSSYESLSQSLSSFSASSDRTDSDPILQTSWSSFTNLTFYGGGFNESSPSCSHQSTAAESEKIDLNHQEIIASSEELFMKNVLSVLAVVTLQIRLYVLSFFLFVEPDMFCLSPLLLRRIFNNKQALTKHDCDHNNLIQQDLFDNKRKHQGTGSSSMLIMRKPAYENTATISKYVFHREIDDNSTHWGFFVDFDEHNEEYDVQQLLVAETIPNLSLCTLEEEDDED